MSGPRSPGWKVARRDSWSTWSSWSSRRRSTAITPVNAPSPPRAAPTPPTTLVPPPKGTTAMRLGTAHLEEPLHLPRVSRLDDGIGRLRPVATPQPPQVGVALAPRMLDPPPAIGVHEAVTDDVTQRSQLRVAEGDRRQHDLLERDRRRLRAARDAERPEHRPPGRAQGVRLGRVTPAVPHRAPDRAGQLIHDTDAGHDSRTAAPRPSSHAQHGRTPRRIGTVDSCSATTPASRLPVRGRGDHLHQRSHAGRRARPPGEHPLRRHRRRRRHHGGRSRARRRIARPARRPRRARRPRGGHEPLELEARARRAALPRQGRRRASRGSRRASATTS